MLDSPMVPLSTSDRVPRLSVLLRLLSKLSLCLLSKLSLCLYLFLPPPLFFREDVIHHGLYTPVDDVGSTGKGLANTAVGANMSVAALPRPRMVWVSRQRLSNAAV